MGFIGFHLCKRLINPLNTIIAYNINSYYDVSEKNRLKFTKQLSKK